MNETLEPNDLVSKLADGLTRLGVERPLMVGIMTGGVWIAQRLHQLMRIEEPLGELSINFYRDDFTRIGLHPRVLPSNLPFDVDGRNIILIDDVLHTGRTIRAALNEIFDYGRPASVTLGVLIDRQDRELPIQPDVSGQVMQLGPNEHIKLTGPEPLELIVQEVITP